MKQTAQFGEADSEENINDYDSEEYQENVEINTNVQSETVSLPVDQDVLAFDQSALMNLNLSSFVIEDTVRQVDHSQDDQIISSITGQHSMFRTNIKARISNLQMVNKWWSSENISATFNNLKSLNDKATINDFLMSTISSSNYKKLPINMEQATELAEFCNVIANTKHERYFMVAIFAARNIFLLFRERIEGLKGFSGGARDLERETRVEKCDYLLKEIKKVFLSSGFSLHRDKLEVAN